MSASFNGQGKLMFRPVGCPQFQAQGPHVGHTRSLNSLFLSGSATTFPGPIWVWTEICCLIHSLTETQPYVLLEKNCQHQD